MTHYKRYGRHTLPWRLTHNPYRILVSEIMLQQTQVGRVIPKYHAFIKQFPTVSALARANLGDVLRAWQGLGYNRRAKFLHGCAKTIVKEYAGKFPRTYNELIELPGIGPYTAGAILAFAYDIPYPIIETNIRSVFLHFCFAESSRITDKEIIPLVQKSLTTQKSTRVWYAALMDYGAYLKETIKNPSHKSAHHSIQKKFKGSDREIRGAILRVLSSGAVSKKKLISTLPCARERLLTQIQRLRAEGLILEKGGVLSFPK